MDDLSVYYNSNMDVLGFLDCSGGVGMGQMELTAKTGRTARTQ